MEDFQAMSVLFGTLERNKLNRNHLSAKVIFLTARHTVALNMLDITDNIYTYIKTKATEELR